MLLEIEWAASTPMPLPKLRGLHLFPRLLRPLITAGTYLRLMPESLICPVYHIARETTPIWWNNRYRIKTLRELEQDLDWLLKLAAPVSLQDLLDWQAGRRDRPRGWFLSFDDGYRELADDIAPLLKRKGIPATFFLCSSLIDNRCVFFEDHAGWIAHAVSSASAATKSAVTELVSDAGTTLDLLLRCRVPREALMGRLSSVLEIDLPGWLKSEQPYLSSAQVHRLLSDGFTVGTHSVDHPLFSEISIEQCVWQIEQSQREMSRQFALPYRVFAFPYGEFGLSAAVLEQLLQACDVQLMFGTRGLLHDEYEPRLVQRLLAEGHISSFGQYISGQLNLQLQRRCMGKAIVRRSGAAW